jgi:prephenate dehydrogenase
MHIRIVGSGLIGTSFALSLKSQGHTLEMIDQNAANQRLARDLIGSPGEGVGDPEVIVIATPVDQIFAVLVAEYERYPEARFIDLGGLKSNLLLEVARIPGLNARFLGTHPMAGREIAGPQGARADLFEGRAWILTPSAQTSPALLTSIKELISATGASCFELEPEIHDQRIALVSHLPQVLSSLLGAMLADKDEDELTLAGGGLRDTSRLAASSPELWGPLLTLNASEVLPLLESLRGYVDIMVNRLESGDAAGVAQLIAQGNIGRSNIPGKHGGKDREYHLLPIVIEDRPGQLAKIFHECEVIGVNVEDLTIEHSPGQETGLVTLALSESDAQRMHSHMVEQGWLAHQPRTA